MVTYGNESVTYPKGFKAASCAAGILPGRNDMAAVVSDIPAAAAVVLTTNKVKAAPVTFDRAAYEKTPYKKGVVINAGNANACTGETGYENTIRTASLFSELIGAAEDEVFVSSTGVIGVQLPIEKILAGVEELVEGLSGTEEAGMKAARAILTTDLVPKTASAEIPFASGTVRIGAMCKGSGMIRPGMATMLAYTTTDAKIDPALLEKMLREIADLSFNAISVDGDMSTNDTAAVLANGRSGVEIREGSPEAEIFFEAFKEVEISLAKQIVTDGEGATKCVEVNVRGAKSARDARVLARSVAESNLVKCAIFGEDANWGRILCALGYADAEFEPDETVLVIRSEKGETLLFENGSPVAFSEEEAAGILKEPVIILDVKAGDGPGEGTCWGCDLSYDYVKINGDYRT